MIDFDKLYHLVQEMNRSWESKREEIRSGRYWTRRAEDLRQIAIVDDTTGATYGYITVDANGTLRKIRLDPDEVSRSSEYHILSAIRMAVNSDAAKAQPESIEHMGVRIYG
ncbi:hypothetical protein IU474_01550 [Nocardia otitidiscaviarum]|uniref:hypothetical protein n=1 Tax=Nocardia otitidiscaviarum TaxID=1823 RepID=UPI0018959327|nr:hypothetical protein [Nocardia otitidiscaviarum]MBF6235766.1 hypothetical protein [Nocardia otitidiscaviarum]